MEKIQNKIKRFLRTGQEDFDALSLELFAYQFEKNLPYQAFCQAQGASPSTVKQWQDIPAVPIQAFKSTELATFPIAHTAAIFYSSATTTGTPSRHYLKDMSYYESALKKSFREWVVPELGPSEHPVAAEQSLPFFVLAPAPAEAPHSSLSWMFDVVKRTWGGLESDGFIQRGFLDEPRLLRALRRAQTEKKPVVLLGTTLAFLRLLDYTERQSIRLELPLGSRLVDTGGMKTERREVTRPVFVQQVMDRLGITTRSCINEYGMCEMSSQFYAVGDSLRMQGPPWVRTAVIDIATGLSTAPGQPGLLRHYDLANVDSVLAIQTEDMGVADGDGFIFQGRAPAAELKGCSLAAEGFLR